MSEKSIETPNPPSPSDPNKFSSISSSSLSSSSSSFSSNNDKKNPFTSRSRRSLSAADGGEGGGSDSEDEEVNMKITDEACSIISEDDGKRTMMIQFNEEEFDRALEADRIREEEEEKAKLSALGEAGQHIGNVVIKKKEERLLNLKIKKPQKKIHSLFGAKMNCECEVYDEVRLTVWILAGVAVLVAVGFFIADLQMHITSVIDLQLHEHVVAISIGAVFAILATILSFVQIRQHYQHWVHPPSQRCVVRILLMVPIYALSALGSLIFLKLAIYIDFARTCYEAFVIYTFMILLTKYLGGHAGVVECMQYKPPLKWPAPMCCMKPAIPGSNFLYWLKYGTLQYTIAAPILSLMAVVMNMFGLYEDGQIDAARGYVYVAFLLNTSQLISLYCLVWLYVVLKNELAPFSPMYKFLVVKSVVFFTFWQGVGLAVLVHLSVLKNTSQFSVGDVQVGLQDFIVCIEMFLAAAAHKYTFGYETYANGTMTLLMEQRALRLAELTYKRAVEEQQKRMPTNENGLYSREVTILTRLPKHDDEELEGEGPAFFDENSYVPENVIAPVILQTEQVTKENKRTGSVDIQMIDLGANNKKYIPLQEGENPFENA